MVTSLKEAYCTGKLVLQLALELLMHRLTLLICSLIYSGVASAASSTVRANNSEWQSFYPNQYASWAETAGTSESIDLLADDPNLVVLWAGYGFAKDYRKARGHAYTVTDLAQTLRTGGPTNENDGPMPASCWSCKSPDVARLYQTVGEAAFAKQKWAYWGHEITHSVGCADCHGDKDAEIQLSRPYAERAMAVAGMDFAKQTPAMQAAQTCGQCHVEYYFDADNHNTVRFPWEHGLSAAGAERFYDKIGFSDWIHGLSKAPMLKAQHPEFETWLPTMHADMGITCISCHMPQKMDDQNQMFSDHKVSSPLDNFELVCADCHGSKAHLARKIARSKSQINSQKLDAEALLVQAHFEAKAAWDSGATAEQMAPALDLIRKAQWRWDFAIASHGIHAHNSKEGLNLLAESQSLGAQALSALQQVLAQLGVAQPIILPDISTKSAAQQAVGLHMNAETEAKNLFIQRMVEGQWRPQVAVIEEGVQE